MWKKNTKKKPKSNPTPGEFSDMEKKNKEWQEQQKKKKERDVTEGFDDNVEDDDMAKNQIHTIRRAAAALEHIIDNDAELPQWIHSKITIAKDYLDTVHEYLQSAEERDVEQATGEEGVEIGEGWKQKVGAAALAGAAALGAGGAGAQTTDKYDPSWGKAGYDTHIKSDRSLTTTMGSDPSKDKHDFQQRIQSVTGPNAKGEYKVVVIQGNDIVSHYVTKTPPPAWLYKNEGVNEDDKSFDLAECRKFLNKRIITG
jgi:hypothetical protein